MLPALIAVGGGSLLAAGSAAALQLGDLRVESTLGQPLRASIAYALNPHEHIQDHCIRLGSSASGLPAIRNARVSVGRDVIRLTGRVPVNDPVIAISLALECPGTPRLSREYTALVDPATAAASAKTRVAATSVRPGDGMSRARDAAAADNSAATRTRPVASGTYRVQPGDSLSGIAAGITGRRMRLWATVETLFVANPDAFINGNRDLLRAGSELVIPTAVLEPGAGVAASARAAPSAPSAAESAPQAAAIAVPAGQEATPAAEAPAAPSAVPGEQSGQTARSAAFEPAIAEPPRQGDVSFGTDGPFVSPIEATPDSSAAAPVEPAAAAAARAPAANPAASGASPADTGSPAWLMWLGGSGAALILVLVLFGRQLKERFGSAAPLGYGRRGADAERDDTTVVAGTHLDASSPDVDLDDAGRLDDSGDIDLAQEFGYAMSGDTGSREDPFGSTAILESEILPSDETGEYDLSMILDATQQKLPNAEDTTKDLRAIQLDEDQGEQADGDYTLSRDVDYNILEQDYQDEMTATQALNAQLSRAALDMQLDIDIDDATSILPAQADEDLVAPEALSAEVDNASASTVEMRPGGGSADGAASQAADEHEDTRADEDLTSMSDAENDPTAQTGETKKLRAS